MQHHRNLPIPDTLADTCDPDRMAPLDALATAGDAILTDIATITGLLAQPTTGRTQAERRERTEARLHEGRPTR
jgi:hypothetical protein